MLQTAWEILIKECPRCKEKLHIHYRSTINERHLMQMVFDDLKFHIGNECEVDNINPMVINIEMETESITTNTKIRLYDCENRKLVI